MGDWGTWQGFAPSLQECAFGREFGAREHVVAANTDEMGLRAPKRRRKYALSKQSRRKGPLGRQKGAGAGVPYVPGATGFSRDRFSLVEVEIRLQDRKSVV